MQSLGQVPIRTGGMSGPWNLILGEAAALNEALFPLDVYRCPKCKRVEFFDLDESLPAR
jgi:hypothetical protein